MMPKEMVRNKLYTYIFLKMFSVCIVYFNSLFLSLDEISLVQGTHVTILEKIDDGWWSGSNEKGQVGLFPAAYVREIKQEVQQKKQSVSEEASVEVERHEPSEVPVMITQEAITSEPVSVSADSPPPSPPSSIHSSSHEVHSED